MMAFLAAHERSEAEVARPRFERWPAGYLDLATDAFGRERR